MSENGRPTGWQDIEAAYSDDEEVLRQQQERRDPRDIVIDRLIAPRGEGRDRPFVDGRDWEADHAEILDLLDLRSPSELPEERPEGDWLIEGLLPTASNVIVGAHPTTGKTLLAMDMAIALASDTGFSGMETAEGRNVGMIIKRDDDVTLRKQVARLCRGRGLDLRDLDGRLFLDGQPRFRLDSDKAMAALLYHVDRHGLDLLVMDAWFDMASGDSDNAAVVESQLSRLSDLRAVSPGLTVMIIHHGKKVSNREAQRMRITDLLRNSSAFGAWASASLFLWKDGLTPERNPQTHLRREFNHHPPAGPMTFVIEEGQDEIRIQETSKEEIALEAQAEMMAEIETYVEEHGGCSRNQIRKTLTGDNRAIDDAFDALVEAGRLRYEPPAKKGLAGSCHVVEEVES